MNEYPLISIIIPIYNNEMFLCECINSVINQTYTNLEIILIDDGSKDKSGQICDYYANNDKRIKVIHQHNQGVSAARNVGLKISNGEYVGFVDGDDYIDLDMFATLIDLNKKYNTEISICSVYNKPILIRNDIKLIPAKDALVLLVSQLYVCNKLFSRKAIKNVTFRTDFSYCEDLYFCLETFTNVSEISYTSNKKYYYRSNLQSATKKDFSLSKLKCFHSFDEIKSFAKKYNMYKLEKCIIAEETADASSFLADLLLYDCPNKEKINAKLLLMVRQNILFLLCSKRRIRNKLFALVCCINFNLAAWLYKQLNRVK